MLEAHRTPGGGSPQGGAVTHHPCFSCHRQPRVRGENAAVRADGDSGDGAATQTRFVLPDWTQTGLRTLLANLRFLLERMDEESRSSLWEELRQRQKDPVPTGTIGSTRPRSALHPSPARVLQLPADSGPLPSCMTCSSTQMSAGLPS